jgi:hypothetical protein
MLTNQSISQNNINPLPMKRYHTPHGILYLQHMLALCCHERFNSSRPAIDGRPTHSVAIAAALSQQQGTCIDSQRSHTCIRMVRMAKAFLKYNSHFSHTKFTPLDLGLLRVQVLPIERFDDTVQTVVPVRASGMLISTKRNGFDGCRKRRLETYAVNEGNSRPNRVPSFKGVPRITWGMVQGGPPKQ